MTCQVLTSAIAHSLPHCAGAIVASLFLTLYHQPTHQYSSVFSPRIKMRGISNDIKADNTLTHLHTGGGGFLFKSDDLSHQIVVLTLSMC